MQSLLRYFENRFSEQEMRDAARILNASYDSFMGDFEVWELVEAVFAKADISCLRTRVVGHQAVNKILLEYFSGERVLKYHIIKQQLNVPDEVTILEMCVDSSRLDIGRINGQSYAYEIKSELDNLNKLEKQIDDYSTVFEYIYVILDRKHVVNAKAIIPKHCGIVTYELSGSNCSFIQLREATYNCNVDHNAQIRNLSSKDLAIFLKLAGIKDIPKTKGERQALALSSLNKQQINELFKETIKMRYLGKWSFLCENFQQILPVDLQLFFHSNVDPACIYYRNSSIV